MEQISFTVGWIVVYDEQYRERVIELGERTGLYKEEFFSKGGTPSYLPEFITVEYINSFNQFKRKAKSVQILSAKRHR